MADFPFAFKCRNSQKAFAKYQQSSSRERACRLIRQRETALGVSVAIVLDLFARQRCGRGRRLRRVDGRER
jgi:hypothetical protein